MSWMTVVAELTDPRRAPLPTTEYVFNSTVDRISHLVVEDTFATIGDAATVCGIVATSADLFPNPGYDMCTVCTEVQS